MGARGPDTHSVAHRYALFLCSLDDSLVGQLTTHSANTSSALSTVSPVSTLSRQTALDLNLLNCH